MGRIIGVDATLTFDPLRSFVRSQRLDNFQPNMACHSRGECPNYYITAD